MFNFFKKKSKQPEAVKSESTTPYPNDSFDDPRAIFKIFRQKTGMNFDKKEQITAGKIRNFCLRHQIKGFRELEVKLLDGLQLMQELIDYLTVNETFFFREPEQIDLLREIVSRESEPVRILCAPCASGEEVYSIIIRFLEADIPIEKFRITGIDINVSAIERAKEALYTARSVNRLNPTLHHKYFTHEGNKYRVIPSLRKLPDFRVKNIFDEGFKELGAFDVIFSRNLFIYFDEKEKKRAVEIFCSLLKDKGKMFFGHADNFSDPVCLTSEFIGRTRVYTKRTPS